MWRLELRVFQFSFNALLHCEMQWFIARRCLGIYSWSCYLHSQGEYSTHWENDIIFMYFIKVQIMLFFMPRHMLIMCFDCFKYFQLCWDIMKVFKWFEIWMSNCDLKSIWWVLLLDLWSALCDLWKRLVGTLMFCENIVCQKHEHGVGKYIKFWV